MEPERLHWPCQYVQTVTEQEQLKETPQALLMFTLEVLSSKSHASQPVGEKSPGILVQQMKEPVCECRVDGLLFSFRLHK